MLRLGVARLAERTLNVLLCRSEGSTVLCAMGLRRSADDSAACIVETIVYTPTSYTPVTSLRA